MSLQFITDNSGQPTGVIIPIKEWNDIRNKYPDVEHIEGELPNWQKSILDARLHRIADSPERLHPIDELQKELDSEEE